MSNYKIKLIPISSLRRGTTSSITQDQVVFEVTPTFSETRTTDYSPVTPVHMPGSIQMYRNTASRQFTIGAHLISRNVEDARVNMQYLQKLRAWMMPYFGSTSTLTDANRASRTFNQSEVNRLRQLKRDDPLFLDQSDTEFLKQAQINGGAQLTGAPPDVLYLYAYSTSANYQTGSRMGSSTSNINRVPVVMASLEISYPDDVDYIPVDPQWEEFGQLEPFPVKMDVNISLVETHSPNEFERFNLAAYKSGTLANF